MFVRCEMVRRLRWTRVIGLGLAMGAAGAWPVAARTERTAPPPPLRVRVQYGDSVWTLAKQYGDSRRDVRAVVAEILRANQVEAAALQPGQELVIPADCLRSSG